MILPDFVTPSRVNQHWGYTGIDSPESCLDIVRFRGYPHRFDYQYNSRGFRDREWPEDLQTAIWCIGDSFTVGLGAPVEHSWPRQLELTTDLPTINISMDGASNDWIAKKALRVLDAIQPQTVVVQWSYLHRRELDITTARQQIWDKFYSSVRDPSWPKTAEFNQLPEHIQHELTFVHGWPILLSDEMRVVHNLKTTVQEDIERTVRHIQELGNRVVHTFIPDFVDRQNRDWFYAELDLTGVDYIKDFDRLDLARDGHHYDIKTSKKYAEKVKSVLERRAT